VAGDDPAGEISVGDTQTRRRLGKRQGRRFHFQRRRFEPIVERKSRRRQLTDDGNVEVTGCDLREKNPPNGQHNLFERAAALSG
jgi:hypothetical protein